MDDRSCTQCSVAGLANNVLREAMKGYFTEGTYSDLTILCQGNTYRVHKFAICAQCIFFAKACDGEFQEAKSGVIDLSCEDPTAVKLMLEYFYTTDYGPYALPGEEEPLLNDATLSGDVLVYSLADKYDISPLKELARQKFEQNMIVMSTSFLPTSFPRNNEDWSTIIKLIYESTPAEDRGLRDIIVKSAAKHAESLFEDVEFGKMVETIGQFGKDLAEYLSKKAWQNMPARYMCPYFPCYQKVFFYPAVTSNLDRIYCCPRCGNRFTGQAWQNKILEQ